MIAIIKEINFGYSVNSVGINFTGTPIDEY